ncbi:hypothetical protein EOD42_07525 [Rhodovarius crocodyli]|uniref:Uncharacterized protein n=1 Tax=Rhodovarius crocodyli TaxID=1979269 RepID=A0A437MJ25_9PROT|nr:hypothetical protein [Rhodovarius crocodyli]RVT97658.1 hypothetical protein EOD42_07525 [Rhodovarius crocodyli]
MSNVTPLRVNDAGAMLALAYDKALERMMAAEKADLSADDQEDEELKATAEARAILERLTADAGILDAIAHALASRAAWVAQWGERSDDPMDIPF